MRDLLGHSLTSTASFSAHMYMFLREEQASGECSVIWQFGLLICHTEVTKQQQTKM
jgi:hypothetical protein